MTHHTYDLSRMVEAIFFPLGPQLLTAAGTVYAGIGHVSGSRHCNVQFTYISLGRNGPLA